MYEYKAFVKRVVDGDTFDALVDLGFKLYSTQRFRLKYIDTPETWRPKTISEAKHGAAATKFVVDLIEGKDVIVNSVKIAVYNRYEAIVTLEDGRDLATLLHEAGFDKRKDYKDL
jgi:micrococcal nuclease